MSVWELTVSLVNYPFWDTVKSNMIIWLMIFWFKAASIATLLVPSTPVIVKVSTVVAEEDPVWA